MGFNVHHVWHGLHLSLCTTISVMSVDSPIVLDFSSMEEDAALETDTDSVVREEEERTLVRANASRRTRAST